MMRWIGIGGLSHRARAGRRAVERARERARRVVVFYCSLFPFEPRRRRVERFWVSFVRSFGTTWTDDDDFFFSRRANTAQDWGCETRDRCVEVFVRARTRAGG